MIRNGVGRDNRTAVGNYCGDITALEEIGRDRDDHGMADGTFEMVREGQTIGKGNVSERDGRTTWNSFAHAVGEERSIRRELAVPIQPQLPNASPLPCG